MLFVTLSNLSSFPCGTLSIAPIKRISISYTLIMLLNVLFNWSMVVWLVVIWASSGFKAVTCVKSSGCKLDALFKLHFDPSKHTFQYAYLVTTCLLLRFIWFQ